MTSNRRTKGFGYGATSDADYRADLSAPVPKASPASNAHRPRTPALPAAANSMPAKPTQSIADQIYESAGFPPLNTSGKTTTAKPRNAVVDQIFASAGLSQSGEAR